MRMKWLSNLWAKWTKAAPATVPFAPSSAFDTYEYPGALQPKCGGHGIPPPPPTVEPVMIPVSIPPSLFSMNMVAEEWGTRWPPAWPIHGLRTFKSGWGKVEKVEGTYDFTLMDNMMRLAQQTGHELLCVMGGKPSWQTNVTLLDPVKLRAYVTAVATRYLGRVHYYELWNEPEVDGFYNHGPLLASLCQVIADAIRAVDPTVYIVGPSINITGVGAQSQLFEQYLDNGGDQQTDAISFHAYPKVINNVAAQPEAGIATIQVVKDILVARNITKPIWNTESGYNIQNNDTYDINACGTAFAGKALTEEEIKAYIPRMMLVNWWHGVQRYYWYGYDHGCMGFMQWNRQSLKAAAFVYAKTQEWLVGKCLEALVEQGGVWTATLSSGVSIVWSPGGNMYRAVDWSVDHVEDVYGLSRPLSAYDHDHFLIRKDPQRLYRKGES